MSQNVLIQNEQVVGAGVSSASQISYDNSGTSLPNNVQGAISSLNVNLTTSSRAISTFSTANYQGTYSCLHFGDLGFVYGFCKVVASSSDWAAVSTLPIHPTERIDYGTYSNQSNADAEIMIKTDGSLSFAGGGAGRVQLFCLPFKKA